MRPCGQVVYEDGDEEWLDLAGEKVEWLEQGAKAAGAWRERRWLHGTGLWHCSTLLSSAVRALLVAARSAPAAG